MVTKNNNKEAMMEEMLKAGLQFGHKKATSHPRMRPYILAVKNDVQIIDLEKTAELLEKALDAVREIMKKKGIIILVGTSPASKRLVKETAELLSLPYVGERWLGGTLTNFSVISKRIGYFRDLLAKKESGELQKYTKKEQLQFDKEISRLSHKFLGLINLTKQPNAIFVFNAKKDGIAIKEAKKMKVSVIALADTDVDPKPIDYPIPANDDSVSVIKFISGKLLETVKEAREADSAQTPSEK